MSKFAKTTLFAALALTVVVSVLWPASRSTGTEVVMTASTISPNQLMSEIKDTLKSERWDTH